MEKFKYYVVFACTLQQVLYLDALEVVTDNPLETWGDIQSLKDIIKQLNYTARTADGLTILNRKKL